jgi:prepilin peptidase CpaA
MWNVFVIAFVVAAAVGDVLWSKIPRSLTVAGFFSGLAHHALHRDLISALLAAAVGLTAGMLLFQMGAIGGGDVKLITALGAMLGLNTWLTAMYAAVLVAAVMAVIQILRRRALRQTLQNMKSIMSGIGQTGLQAHPFLHVRNPALLRSPFGVAAAVGTLIAVIR